MAKKKDKQILASRTGEIKVKERTHKRKKTRIECRKKYSNNYGRSYFF